MDYELRIVVEKVAVSSQEVIKRDTITSYALQRPTSIGELGLRHVEQISLLENVQNILLTEQSVLLDHNPHVYPCAPQKLICHFTDRLIQPQLRLTHQEPITVGDGTHNWREDRVDVSDTDGAYQGKATDDRVGERLLYTRHHTDKR